MLPILGTCAIFIDLLTLPCRIINNYRVLNSRVNSESNISINTTIDNEIESELETSDIISEPPSYTEININTNNTTSNTTNNTTSNTTNNITAETTNNIV
jgi:hypothetical protein